ncbi:hypothetical protein U0C82_18530 [Fulvimarina sp. 2208YS6-2-32]|uniref:Uncharacterized protein n=1 Tax=Fulvimarina uroteuthidis TaxID=3098149 RepID=A0ABU5I6U9_9HYPH|nr:hypothetical protein [Fulvimarina sp. 2208YS6-2-32]MDY8111121.1 hypothetical protein [Fulvimarina sp. 2208YS6-2-32]
MIVTFTTTDRAEIMRMAWAHYRENRFSMGFRATDGFRGDLFGRSLKRAWSIVRNRKIREADGTKARIEAYLADAARHDAETVSRPLTPAENEALYWSTMPFKQGASLRMAGLAA